MTHLQKAKSGDPVLSKYLFLQRLFFLCVFFLDVHAENIDIQKGLYFAAATYIDFDIAICITIKSWIKALNS
jgi:hypothetical protein